jgi:hypothetical protein
MKPKKIVQVISLTISIGGLVTRIVRWFKLRRRRRSARLEDAERRARAMRDSKITHDGPKRMTAAAERREHR